MMSTFITSTSRLRLWQAALAAGALLCVALPAHAQTDRERQQMLQLQQQLQKLRQENAQLQQGKAAEIEKARAEGEKVRADADRVKREAGQLRVSGSAAQREVKRLGEELEKATQALAQSQADNEKLRAEMVQRDATQQAALQAAQQAAAQQLALERRNAEAAASVLGARLKSNTARADMCEARHDKALALGKDLLDRYEARQLRACEPFTGLWRVREETEIQTLRDRLFESRLDVGEANASAPEGETR
jgi:chromosome segregation ATPase